jgi:hypothetical protein
MKEYTLSDQDLWKEFTFWRSIGRPDIAFTYLRSYNTNKLAWMILLAGIIDRVYRHEVVDGDIIRHDTKNISFEWNRELASAFEC